MPETRVTDPKPDRATLVAVLAAAEGSLLLGGLARWGQDPGRRGPYTLVTAVEAAAGCDPAITAAALEAVAATCPGRADCPVCDKDCRELACWIASDPDLVEVGAFLRAAMARLTLEAVR